MKRYTPTVTSDWYNGGLREWHRSWKYNESVVNTSGLLKHHRPRGYVEQSKYCGPKDITLVKETSCKTRNDYGPREIYRVPGQSITISDRPRQVISVVTRPRRYSVSFSRTNENNNLNFTLFLYLVSIPKCLNFVHICLRHLLYIIFGRTIIRDKLFTFLNI
jgi:hypothetical protein